MGAEQADTFRDPLCCYGMRGRLTQLTFPLTLPPASAVTKLSSGLYSVSILIVGTCCRKIKATE